MKAWGFTYNVQSRLATRYERTVVPTVVELDSTVKMSQSYVLFGIRGKNLTMTGNASGTRDAQNVSTHESRIDQYEIIEACSSGPIPRIVRTGTHMNPM